MARITKVAATGSKFGQHGDHYVNIEVELDTSLTAMDDVQYYPEWANVHRRDKHHRVDFSRYDKKKCVVTYHPEIVFADEHYERWQLRKLDDLKALAMRYATEVEAEARRIEPLAKKAKEIKAMVHAIDSYASIYVPVYPDRDGGELTIEISLTAHYEYVRQGETRRWSAPQGFMTRYRDSDESFHVRGQAETRLTAEGLSGFGSAEAALLYQRALDSLNKSALWAKVGRLCQRLTTPQVSISAVDRLNGKGDLLVWLNGSQKRKEFDTWLGILNYLESHDAEAIKADFGYAPPSPGQVTSAERAERARRAAERKALADAKAKLEADWKALVEAANVASKPDPVDSWDEESEQ